LISLPHETLADLIKASEGLTDAQKERIFGILESPNIVDNSRAYLQ
jgi:hypothetical protein